MIYVKDIKEGYMLSFEGPPVRTFVFNEFHNDVGACKPYETNDKNFFYNWHEATEEELRTFISHLFAKKVEH